MNDEGDAKQQPKDDVRECPCCGTKIETDEAKAGYRRWRRIQMGLFAVAGVLLVLSWFSLSPRGMTGFSGFFLALSLGIILTVNTLNIFSWRG